MSRPVDNLITCLTTHNMPHNSESHLVYLINVPPDVVGIPGSGSLGSTHPSVSTEATLLSPGQVFRFQRACPRTALRPLIRKSQNAFALLVACWLRSRFLRSVASSSMLFEDGEVGYLEVARCAVLLTHKWLALRRLGASPLPVRSTLSILRCSVATRFYAFITAV